MKRTKTKTLLPLILFSFLLTGCQSINLDNTPTKVPSPTGQITPTSTPEVTPSPTSTPHVHTFSNTYSYDETYHWFKSTCGHNVVSDKEEHTYCEWDIVKEATYDNVGYKVRNCQKCNYEQSEIIPVLTPPPAVETTLTIDIYASNDFHGAVEPTDSDMGLLTFMSYMKKVGENENTLLIDQGDTWQGSIYSNINYGALINDAMCLAKYDARTVGNHDFDWGVDKLIANTKRSYNNYTVPVLAANVYNYDFEHKVMGNIQQEDIGQKSVTYVLENGLKVGIVGVIGQDQITSITSNYVMDIGFKNHIEVIKEEATKLREDGCDVVICSAHTGQESLYNNNLKNYVDLVLCGHTHRQESFVEEGNFLYAQFGANGDYIGHIQLTYDTEQKKVVKTTMEAKNKYKINNELTEIDGDISDLINKYYSECEDAASEVLVKNAGYFSRYEEAPNLMCRVIMDECVKEGYDDVILSFTNESRKNIYYGSWTYEDIYSAFPFDNIIYIASLKGSEILYEVLNYNYVCFADGFDGKIDPNEYYQIAIIDFLLFHTNSARYYNFFPSFNGETIGQLKDNYRVLLTEWLKENGYNNSNNYLNPDDYSSSIAPYDKSILSSN